MEKYDSVIDELKAEIEKIKTRLTKIEQILLKSSEEKKLLEADDVLLPKAKKLVQHFDTVSASFLQRKLVIGYSRAARLLDQLEEQGIVGHAEGSKPRKVLPKKAKLK